MLKVTLIGHLGRDPEMRYMPSGDPVTSVSVACPTGAKDADGHRVSSWVNVTFFNKLAEVANQYLVKGSQVYVEGRLKVRTYQRQDGTTAVSTDVAADKLEMLSSGKQQAGEAQAGAPAAAATETGATAAEDLPF